MVKLQAMLHSNYLFFCDIETSGSCAINNGIIQFSMIVTNHDYEVVDEFRYNVKPPHLNEYNWSKEAEKYHGISYKEVLTYPSNRQFCYDFLLWIKKYKNEYNFPLPFICHATPYTWWNKEEEEYVMGWIDYYFLQWAMMKEGYEYSFYKVFNHGNLISTIDMAIKLGFTSGNKLSVWARKLGFKDFNHHDSYQDTLVTIELYKYLRNLGLDDERFKNKKAKKAKNGNKNNLSLQF